MTELPPPPLGAGPGAVYAYRDGAWVQIGTTAFDVPVDTIIATDALCPVNSWPRPPDAGTIFALDADSPGLSRLAGKLGMAAYYLASCPDCDNPEWPLPVSFTNEADRMEWVFDHAKSTGHVVELSMEIR